MRKYLSFKNIAIFLGIVLLIMQFFRIDKSHPDSKPASDFISIYQTPKNIADILHRACYDCHSYQTIYPWYSNIAPVSWWLQDHIEEGREELNFSEWDSYTGKEKSKKMKRAAKEVKEGEMPLSSFTLVHKNARLNYIEKELLQKYFTEIEGSPVPLEKIPEPAIPYPAKRF